MAAVDRNVSKSDFHICGTFFFQNCTFQAIVFYFNLKTVLQLPQRLKDFK